MQFFYQYVDIDVSNFLIGITLHFSVLERSNYSYEITKTFTDFFLSPLDISKKTY